MNDRLLPSEKFKKIAAVHPDGQTPKRRVSARIYEFFCTNFAQHNPCVHKGVNLGEDYIGKSHSFAFYRRNKERIYNIEPDTTGGPVSSLPVTDDQLAFFEWVVEHDVFNYINDRLSVINKARDGMKQLSASRIVLAGDETATMDELAEAFDGMGLPAEEEVEVKVGPPRNRRYLSRSTQEQRKNAQQQRRLEEQEKKHTAQHAKHVRESRDRAIEKQHRLFRQQHDDDEEEEDEEERERLESEAHQRRQIELAHRRQVLENIQITAERDRVERDRRSAREKQDKMEAKNREREKLKAERQRLQEQKTSEQAKRPKTRSRSKVQTDQPSAQWLYPLDETQTSRVFTRRLGW